MTVSIEGFKDKVLYKTRCREIGSQIYKKNLPCQGEMEDENGIKDYFIVHFCKLFIVSGLKMEEKILKVKTWEKNKAKLLSNTSKKLGKVST